MSSQKPMITSLLLMLAALPLVAVGTAIETAPLWWAGLALLAIGAAIPPLTRFGAKDDDEDEAKRDSSGDDS